ncbi:MAG: multicopper oxidase family protein [Candidatus Moranbacteria bacterium]|nr:multicopper oxidase family protein [Candidatus Moranbacteria bacterium]
MTTILKIGAVLIIIAVAVNIFLLRNNKINLSDFTRVQIPIAQDIANLPEAKPFESEPVALQDGDVFDMSITPVKKNINGQWVRMLGYNGSVPGPALRIPQGAQITVRLTNNGDIATTLHSHGVRMENAFDGVPDVTQKAIEPGETFEYKLKFPDAGVFWYHPHVRTDYTLESGLYGNYIVTPTDTAYWLPANREVPIILDDIAMDKSGLLPFSKDTTDHTLMGRFGNVMFTNGETGFRPNAKQGEVVRLYFTNAANTRVFNVAIPGAKMKLVGADLGRYAQEKFTDEVMIAPGERRVVDVLFEKAGAYQLIHKTPGKSHTLETIAVSDENVTTSYAQEFNTLRHNASVGEETNALMDTYLSKAPDKKLSLELDMSGAAQGMMNSAGGGHMGGGHMMSNGSMMSGADMGMGDDGDAIEWEDTMSAMNSQTTAKMMTWRLTDDATKKSNMDVKDWKFKVGDKVKIRIFNDPKSAHPMQHPIHFHGQRFLVLSTNGVKNDNPVWQDTTLILKGDTVDILLETSNPGVWMAHCHILEHAESGMMIPFTVE